MAEIKSTMDLIMEKTKHLSMTEEEKTEKNREEARQKIQGLIRRFEDKTIKPAEFEKTYASIKAAYHDGHAVDIDAIARQELLACLDFDRNNAPVLHLLATYFQIDSQGLYELFEEYNTAVENSRQTVLAKRKQALAENRQISGSAVKPNLEADPAWTDELHRLQSEYGKRLAELKQTISTAAD